MDESVGLLAALTAGLISFISPCVLPVVPAYLSFVSGMSIDEMKGNGGAATGSSRLRLFLNCLAFVLGFSTVFIMLGASATVVGGFMNQNAKILSKIAGVIIVVFGLHTMGVIKIPFLNYEKRFHQNTKSAGLIGSFLFGLAFAFGWTPCIGPILGAILGVAASSETVGEGILLLAVYSLGLGIPFLLAGLFVESFFRLSGSVKKQFHLIEKISGFFMIAVGLMIFFDRFPQLSSWVSQLLPWLSTIG
ncbi:MAG: cytochrome c-type bioproteinis protein [bacterium]|nr:MAG: cytochrome c-type bioproteinis protein [bacterium]